MLLFFNHLDIFHRIALSIVTSFCVSLYITKKIIHFSNQRNIRQPIRDDGPESHSVKIGTPSLGGVAILIAAFVTSILFVDFIHEPKALCMLLIIVFFGAIGFVDDMKSISSKSSRGLSGKLRLLLGLSASLFLTYIYFYGSDLSYSYSVFIPFIKFSVSLGFLFIIYAAVFITGMSNTINILDGMDGMASKISATLFLALIIVGYFTLKSTHMPLLTSFDINVRNNIFELLVIGSAMLGGTLGFLWYNFYPAKIFMGDTGSLSIGAALGFLAIAMKQELLLMFMAMVAIADIASTVIQVISFKTRGKRVFKMAPIHHHFEQLGIKETHISERFWMITIILCILGISFSGII